MDFSKIKGYSETLTADEKLKLITEYVPEEPDLKGYVLKDLFDRTSSDLAGTKKLLKEKLSEAEIKEAERLAAETSIKEELNAYKKKEATATYKSKFLEIGYDPKLAEESAAALIDADTEKFFQNQKAHLEAIKKAALASALVDDKPLPSGGAKFNPNVAEEIATAMSNSDFGAAAALIRLSQETKNNKE